MKTVTTLAAPGDHDDPLTDVFVGTGAGETYYIDSPDDVIIEAPGGGTDRVLTPLPAYALPANVENLAFIGPGDFTGDGNELDNVIIGGGWNDVLSGGLGRDTLVGRDGDDWLDGGSGLANQMQGGAGDDTYVVSAAGDTIVEFGGGGVDAVRTGLAAFTLAANIENLDFTGTGQFVGVGNARNNLITGGVDRDTLAGRDGDDTLSGGSGAANTLIGGLGDDTYVVQVVGDSVIEYLGEGTDTVRTTLGAYTLRDHLENLTYAGTGEFTGAGNALANTIQGGSWNDSLNGGAGDDVLEGLSEWDRLDGGSGDDRLYGGTGQDTLIGGAGADILDGGADADWADYAAQTAPVRVNLAAQTTQNDGQGGVDTLIAVEHATGGSGADVLIGDASGNDLNGGPGADMLVGQGGGDWLDGGLGLDTLQGGLGDDFYWNPEPGDSLVEFAGEGVDTIWVLAIDYTMPAHFENLHFRNPGVAHRAYGNDEDNEIEGGDLGDELAGGAGNDILTGRWGDDVLRGDSGDDLLIGFDGVDTAVMSGLASGYALVRNADGSVTITDTATGAYGDDGADTMYEVEFVRFGDGTVLDVSTVTASTPDQSALAAPEAVLSRIRPTADLAAGDFAATLHPFGESWDAP